MRIAVVGYGVEGRSLAKYFRRHHNEVTVCDVNKIVVGYESGAGMHFRLGPNYLDRLDQFDLVFRSPGIPYIKKEFQAVRSKLTSLTKYFFEKCPCPIIGVTGTKGKGTVATLIFEMLKAAPRNKRQRVFLGGNIGASPLDFLDELSPKDVVVLELSSFQLQDLGQSPHVAVVLGIVPDHLDHHADMEEYIEAKKNIVRFLGTNDFAVFDIDNPVAAGFARETKAKVLQVSIEKTVGAGGFLKIGSLIIKKGNTGIIAGQQDQIFLLGQHNIKNLLAAAVAADALGVPVSAISKVVREFRGLPHRLEFVGETAGVRFYNDSASTNPYTTIAALKSFASPIVLIVGGSDKNTDFGPLATELVVNPNVKTVVLMGETKQKIEQAIDKALADAGGRKNPLELIFADSYPEAFMVLRAVAQSGDTVLLSPACASFDMFANFKERGDVFRNFVLEVP